MLACRVYKVSHIVRLIVIYLTYKKINTIYETPSRSSYLIQEKFEALNLVKMLLLPVSLSVHFVPANSVKPGNITFSQTSVKRQQRALPRPPLRLDSSPLPNLISENAPAVGTPCPSKLR